MFAPRDDRLKVADRVLPDRLVSVPPFAGMWRACSSTGANRTQVKAAGGGCLYAGAHAEGGSLADWRAQSASGRHRGIHRGWHAAGQIEQWRQRWKAAAVTLRRTGNLRGPHLGRPSPALADAKPAKLHSIELAASTLVQNRTACRIVARTRAVAAGS